MTNLPNVSSGAWLYFPWPLIVRGVPDQVPLARATKLTRYCWQDSHSFSRKKWTYLCHTLLLGWVEGQDWSHLLLLGRGRRKPCHYVGPPLQRSLTSPPSSFHFSEFSFGCLSLFPHIQLFSEFTVVVNRETFFVLFHNREILLYFSIQEKYNKYYYYCYKNDINTQI